MQGFGDIAVISIEHLNSYNMKKVILKVGLMLLAVGQFTGNTKGRINVTCSRSIYRL